MRLQDIGFYTLSDERADTASKDTPLIRGELLVGGMCNFNCKYCRHVGGPDIPLEDGIRVIDEFARHGLFAIRFSGGEPIIHPHMLPFVRHAKANGIKRIAVSTNGSADFSDYSALMDAGVDDFSISLDACCAEDGDKMAGGVKGAWDKVVDNIRRISSRCYVTVGVVLTVDNVGSLNGIISFADSLGVADIRIIPAAQEADRLTSVSVDEAILARHPILRYRVANIRAGKPCRGLQEGDSRRCGLAVDDAAVMGDEHFPCIIYLREGGEPIGKVGPTMREERHGWYRGHDTSVDPICRRNCLDVCVCHNNRFAANNPCSVELHGTP